MDSPLITGKQTGTSLDFITNSFMGIIPFTNDQIKWLNKIIFKNDKLSIYINNWVWTHLVVGIIFGIIFTIITNKYQVRGLNITTYLILHTIFEIWELIAVHKLFNFNLAEFFDIIFDTLFALIGFKIGNVFVNFICS